MLCLSEASSCPDLSVSELERIKADAKLCWQKFRMASLDLATILGDQYANEQRENEKNIYESAQNKISELTSRKSGKPGVIQKGFWGNRP